MHGNLYEFKNFVDVSLCHEICGTIESTPTRSCTSLDFFYVNRTRDIDAFKTSTRVILEKIIDDVISKMREVYNSPDLVINHADVVSSPDGHTHDVHSDSFSITTGEKYTHPGLRKRAFTGIVYLNDKFRGGETFFPKLYHDVIPEIGKLVIYPADILHQHGVKEVMLSGDNTDRYTLSIWVEHSG